MSTKTTPPATHIDKTIGDLLREMQGHALSTDEVYRIFGFSRPGLHKLTRKAAIPHHRIGDRIKFDPIVLLRWWEAGKLG